jgi:hypothetical protein
MRYTVVPPGLHGTRCFALRRRLAMAEQVPYFAMHCRDLTLFPQGDQRRLDGDPRPPGRGPRRLPGVTALVVRGDPMVT